MPFLAANCYVSLKPQLKNGLYKPFCVVTVATSIFYIVYGYNRKINLLVNSIKAVPVSEGWDS